MKEFRGRAQSQRRPIQLIDKLIEGLEPLAIDFDRGVVRRTVGSGVLQCPLDTDNHERQLAPISLGFDEREAQ